MLSFKEKLIAGYVGTVSSVAESPTDSAAQAQSCSENVEFFKGHDFNTVLFNSQDKNDWLPVGEFISKRMSCIFSQDKIYLTYAGVASEYISVDNQPFDFFVALRNKLSYQDLSTGNITINGYIVETFDFMQMMDALVYAHEYMRIPPYSKILKEQFWADFTVRVYGEESVYGATPYHITPGGQIRKMSKLITLAGLLLANEFKYDRSIGCRVNDYKDSDA